MTERNHHQHPRRPPDVEEALSSMLWTPYERPSTDSSSEDDDEKLNKRLRKSRNGYDDDNDAKNNDNDVSIVASTTAAAAAAAAFVPMTSSYFGCNDFLMPTTHFVPLSNIMFNNININSTATANVAVVTNINQTYQPYHYQQHHHEQHHLQQHSLSSLNAPECHKSNGTATNNNYRFSYPHYGPTPSLNAKSWWSSTSAAALEPPSYESLYSKNSSVMRLEGSSKGLKPVLHSLKATTVTTMRANNGANAENQLTKRIESDAAEEAAGRLVHSFTDNFMDESCTELPESVDISYNNNNNNKKANNNNTNQKLPPSNMNIEHLKFINNVAKLSREQVVESNNNDVTVSQPGQPVMVQDVNICTQRKRKRLPNAKSKQTEETNNKNNSEKSSCYDHYDDDDDNDYDHECLQKVDNKKHQQNAPPLTPVFIDDDNRQQVNQPASVAERETTTTTTTQQMNSPTSISNKSTTTTTSRNHNKSSVVSLAVEQRPATTISSSRAFVECGSLSLSSPLLRKFTLRPSSTRRKVVNPAAVGTVKSSDQSEQPQQQPLTPNKCLAELERLRAEIHGSESQSKHQSMLVDNKMRLSIPPATVAVASQPTIAATASTNAPKFVPTTSSVFLTTNNLITNNNNNSCSNNVSNYHSSSNVSNDNYNNNNNCSVAILTTKTTTATKPCQRQPSLTIQVNNSNNNNPNNNTNVVSSPTVLNESIVNNNGISVVNCNYVQSENSSNRNSSVGVSVNSSSSVPNVFSSSSSSSNDSISSRPANAAKSSKNITNNGVSVAPTTTATTATVTNRESVNVISVNSQPNYTQRLSATTTPPSPTSSSSNSTPATSPTRTFTSTECQTDDIESVHLRTPVHRFPFQPPPFAAASSAAPASREQRRRERRERRHQQHQLQQLQQLQHVVAQLPPPHHHQHAATRRHSERHSLPAPPLPPPHAHPHQHPPLMHHASVPSNATMPPGMSALLRPMLPDILHSHFPPPYSALSVAGDSISTLNVGPSPPQRPPPPPPPTAAALGHATMLTPVISTVPLQGGTTIVSDGRFSIPLPIIRRSPSERSGKGCCGQWFAGPPLRALIAVVALGGVACALGGAALGATGLAGPPSSHFTAALLMIGVGVVLVTVSGAAWRMTAPGGPPCLGLGSSVDLGRCGRRPCSRGGGAPHGLLYPEFQHRPPPPSYQASMQEYRLRLLLLDRDRQNGVVRGNSPPPTYRSHTGSLLRASLTTTMRGGGGGSGSVGGSEYSLPPSYRSRNATPATICSERSIETAPSGRLLANEDIPEPLSAELLPQYSSLQRLHRQLTDLSTQPTSQHLAKSNAAAASTTATTMSGHSAVGHQLRTSAIVEVEAAPNEAATVATDKISLVCHKEMRTSGSASVSAKGKELVTIVTISQNHSDVTSPNEGEMSTGQQQHQQQQQPSNDQMQILAHL